MLVASGRRLRILRERQIKTLLVCLFLLVIGVVPHKYGRMEEWTCGAYLCRHNPWWGMSDVILFCVVRDSDTQKQISDTQTFEFEKRQNKDYYRIIVLIIKHYLNLQYLKS